MILRVTSGRDGIEFASRYLSRSFDIWVPDKPAAGLTCHPVWVDRFSAECIGTNVNVIEFAYSRTLRTQSHRLRVIGYLGCKQGETRGVSSGFTLTFGVRPDDQHEQAAALGLE